jgi:hypothetical protein
MHVRLTVAGAAADAEIENLWDLLERQPGLGRHLSLSRGQSGTYDMSAGAVEGIIVALQPGVVALLTVTIREFCRRDRRKPGTEITVTRPGAGSVTVKIEDTDVDLSEALASVSRLLEVPPHPHDNPGVR